MFNYSNSSPTIINCTFSANQALGSGSSGGAIGNYISSVPTLANCILWLDSAASSPEIVNLAGSNSSTTVSYSDVYGGYVGATNINADPRFVYSPRSGPDGNWGTADDNYGNLKIQSTSPCIDVAGVARHCGEFGIIL